jgi:hypothetical protein
MPLEMTGPLIEQMRYHGEPYIRHAILVDVLGEDRQAKEPRILRDEVKDTILVKTLLAERDAAGRIPLDPYAKWRGAHWVLGCLADLGYPEADPGLLPLREQVWEWLLAPEYERAVAARAAGGLHRWHAGIEGYALYYLLRLGLADARLDLLVGRLLSWQWPDGGWNCDQKPGAHTSSFTETLLPLRGLALHAQRTGSSASRAAAERAAEVLLERRLFRRRRDGQIIRPDFVRLHYPCYWHYDILCGLKAMVEVGRIKDQRCAEALDLLESKQLADGGFPAEAKHYRIGREEDGGGSLVNWGGTGKRKLNEFVTADSFQVLRAAGRLRVGRR